ncbi:MAG: hemerythrin domain-containing protein [Cytophagales bacterium]|nr:hemerythrin domain-containing protein [Cytophagales bacterium]
MKIIDRETGKRNDDEGKREKSDLKKSDPIERLVEKGLEADEEFSPMDPPTAYDPNYAVVDAGTEHMPDSLISFKEDHKEVVIELDKFEAAMLEFNKGRYQMTKEINDTFGAFFLFFDETILPHNREEERHLFPVLKERLMESGEHSKEPIPKTAVDLMEDDHVKFIQLATLTLNLLGLAARLRDQNSRALTVDLAYHNGIELIELMRLHIFREDNTLFPLAHKLLSVEEFKEMGTKLNPTA